MKTVLPIQLELLYFGMSQNWFPSTDFSISERGKSHRDWSQAKNEAEEPQQCFYWAKTRICIEVTVWQAALSWCDKFFTNLSVKVLIHRLVLRHKLLCGRFSGYWKTKPACIWSWTCSFLLFWALMWLKCTTPCSSTWVLDHIQTPTIRHQSWHVPENGDHFQSHLNFLSLLILF